VFRWAACLHAMFGGPRFLKWGGEGHVRMAREERVYFTRGIRSRGASEKGKLVWDGGKTATSDPL